VNDDGLLVPVGEGNSYTEGQSKSLWGSSVTIGGEDFTWGIPVMSWGVDTSTVAGLTTIDTTQFLAMGSSMPDFNVGYGNTVRFKGFSLYALFDAQVGGDIYNGTRQWQHRESTNFQVDQLGKEEGNKKPLKYYQTLYNVNENSSYFVESATYVKFRELSLQYTFNRGQLENVLGGLFKRISIQVIGRNLLTWSDYLGFDPEVSQSSTGAVYRVDDFDYPNYRTITGAIELEF
jgi:hypothetical protein